MAAAAYFGESVRHAADGADWSQWLDNKCFADYGHAILVGAGLKRGPTESLADHEELDRAVRRWTVFSSTADGVVTDLGGTRAAPRVTS